MLQPQMIVILALTLALSVGVSVQPQDFDIHWRTIDAGGLMFSSGGDYELSGTVGQPDAGAMTGGEFELTGGFWFELPQGDCNSTGSVDLLDYDDFESCLAGPDAGVAVGCECFDVNRSDTVDLLDFAVVQTTFTGSLHLRVR